MDANPGEEVDYQLPTAAEVAAELRATPEAATDDDPNKADDDEESEAETPEETTAREAAIAKGLGDDDESENDETESTDESEKTAEGDASEEASGDETTEEEPAEEPPTPAQAKTGFEKRIGEITQRAKTAETQVAQLREQVAAANYSAPAFGQLALVDDLGSLRAAEQNELALHKWALLNETREDGADLPDGKGGQRHFEQDEIRQIKANTFEALYSHVPARRDYLREKTAADTEAAHAYPWLRDTRAGDGAAVQKMIEDRPYLRSAPDYRTVAADATIGAKLRKAGIQLDDKAIAALAKGRAPVVKIGGKPAASAQPGERAAAPIVRRTSPSPARPGVLPPRLNGREAAAKVAEKRLNSSSGNLEDLSNSIAAKMRF